jgi:replication-associated recombination protein RarA
MTDTKTKLTEEARRNIETSTLASAAAQMLLDNAAGDVAELLVSLDVMIRTIGETTGLCPGCILESLSEHIEHAPSAEDEDDGEDLDVLVDILAVAGAPKQIH